jgi:hypothetical protein
MLEMSIPNEDTGTKNLLSNTKLYFWPEGALACGENQHKGGQAISSPLYP